LAKSREARYQSAFDLLAAIYAALNTSAEQIPVRANVPSGFYDSATMENSASTPKRSAGFWTGLLGFIFLIGIVFLIFKLTPAPNSSLADFESQPMVVNTTTSFVLPTPIQEQPETNPLPTVSKPTSKPAPTATRSRPTEFSCPGAPHPVRFTDGQSIYVCTNKDTLAVRAQPAGDILKRLVPGSDLIITGGPRCTNSVIWWKVRTESGTVGWVMDGADSTDRNFICAVP
jgi:hypothetical protein